MNLCSGRSTPDSGFTLLEILLAVSLLSVVLSALYGTFFMSHRAMEGAGDSMERLQEARRAIDILRCELEATYYDRKSLIAEFATKDKEIDGRRASELAFTAFSSVRPGLSRISYSVEEKEGKLVLLKKMKSPYRKADKGEEADLIEDLKGFTIEAKFNDTWVGTWDAGVNEGMPEEIRIGLIIAIKGRDVSLSDIAKPRIGKAA